MCKSEKNRKNETNAFPVWLIVGIVGVLILLAYVVHRLSPQIASLITADGMLSYIGSGISSVATIVLAIVAYRQTERANSMADKLTQQSNSFAEQANELAQQSNKVAKRANELTEKANGISERVTNLEEALGDIRGVTYIYGMFYRFGLIEMPDKVNGKMKRAGRQM